MDLSIVIPTINSEKIIERTVVHIDSYLKNKKEVSNYEIIIAAQRSKDNTFEVIKRLKSKHIIPLYLSTPGKGIGLNAGVRKARYEWIVMIDDDMSYPIEFLDDAIPLSGKYDILIGSRYITKQNIPLRRKIPGWGYRKFVKLLFGIPVEDVQAGLKLIRRNLFDKISVSNTGYVWDTEFIYKALKLKFKIKEVPIRYVFLENVLRLNNAIPKMLSDVIKLRLKSLKYS